ncbi:pseudouridine-5'-phosphatase-like [Lycorma delicatula]|uniref:pseudouridine-5'-phosphatase-like n=1 Tax=Lycorma delicatula TaxID=130591 RepID=UPI003F51740C
MSRIFSQVTHVIFDVDGTIFDTQSLTQHAYREVAKIFGKTLTLELNSKLLGRTEKDANSIFITELGLPDCARECITMKKNTLKEANPIPNFMPGIENLVLHLKEHNIPMAMATSSKYDSIAKKFKHHQTFYKKFSHVMAADDPEVKNPKPAPDIYIICASKFSDKPNPKDCLAIEDAPSGVQSAASAGMQVVMVPYPEISEELTKDATIVLKSISDFKPELFGLPPFPN